MKRPIVVRSRWMKLRDRLKAELIALDHEWFVSLVLVQAFDGHTFGSPERELICVRPRLATSMSRRTSSFWGERGDGQVFLVARGVTIE